MVRRDDHSCMDKFQTHSMGNIRSQSSIRNSRTRQSITMEIRSHTRQSSRLCNKGTHHATIKRPQIMVGRSNIHHLTHKQWPTYPKQTAKHIQLERNPVQIHVQISDNKQETNEENHLIQRFSSLQRLINITAYCLRWKIYKQTTTKNNAVLSAREIKDATDKWIKIIQQSEFAAEINSLQKGKLLLIKSRLITLNPILDKNNILRVGGRINLSHHNQNKRHPIIIPQNNHFTTLLIRNAHQKTLHGGTHLTRQYLQNTYWIIHPRSTIRAQLKTCTICWRYQKQMQQQQMGNLPHMRVQQYRPFTHTGIDFAGYFEVKISEKRNATFTKCYAALFICLTTRAIHLELVSSLTTTAFLAALRRFTSRRGLPAHIYSDQGTNFVGASNELPKLLHNATNQQTQEMAQQLAESSMQWLFNPAHAPHFGGSWEEYFTIRN